MDSRPISSDPIDRPILREPSLAYLKYTIACIYLSRITLVRGHTLRGDCDAPLRACVNGEPDWGVHQANSPRTTKSINVAIGERLTGAYAPIDKSSRITSLIGLDHLFALSEK